MDSRYSPDHHHRYASQSSQDSHSHNHKLFIERNSQQQQQIVIPYWDEQSSSAHLHLIEEIRLLKKKNTHFQSHMGRMKAEYEQLRLSLELMDENQKEHIRKFAELTQRYNLAITKIQQLKAELEITRNENGDLRGDLRVKDLREDENRKRIIKLKDQQGILNTRIMDLESQLKLIRLRSEEEKRIMEKSFHAELSMLKQNLQGQRLPPVSESRAHNEEHEQVVNRLRKQNEQILEEHKKLKIEHEKCGKNDTAHDTHPHAREIEKLKSEINQLRIENIKARDEKDYLRMQVAKLEHLSQKKQNQTERQRKNKIDRPIHLTIPGEPKVQLPAQVNNVAEQDELQNKIRRSDVENGKLLARLQELQLRHHEKEESNTRTINLLNQSLRESGKKIAEKEQQIRKLLLELQQIKNSVEAGSKKPDEEGSKQGRIEAEEEKSLTQLEEEYNNEVQALRRLILYKKYPPVREESENKIRQQYQQKFDQLVVDYQKLQRELIALQEQVVEQRHQREQESSKEVITFRTSEEQRIIYLQAIRKWEIAYEELHAIYKAKLVSKDEEINLLNLRLANRMDYS